MDRPQRRFPGPHRHRPRTPPPTPAETVVQCQPNTEPRLSADGGPPTRAITDPAALVGQSLGGFELVAQLGGGGIGIVYKARHQSDGRVVALKLLRARYLDDEVCVTRFLTEARATAELRHPNIVRVYELGTCRAGPYFAMELIDGPSLESRIRQGVLPLLWVVNLLIRLAETLHFAHGKGILHRDLKPTNVLLDGDERPVVIDFGLVKYLGQAPSLTRQGEVLGTPSYMAPEQAGEDLDQVGPHSDVYSLGAILYTMLTGRVPYDEGSTMRTILKVVGPDMPPAVRSLRPEVPEELERLCTRCLSKRPADRYASAQDLADELRQFRDGALFTFRET